MFGRRDKGYTRRLNVQSKRKNGYERILWLRVLRECSKCVGEKKRRQQVAEERITSQLSRKKKVNLSRCISKTYKASIINASFFLSPALLFFFNVEEADFITVVCTP
jgi:hypothetical protein